MQLDVLEPAFVEPNYNVNKVGGQRFEDGENIDAYVNKGRALAKLNRHTQPNQGV